MYTAVNQYYPGYTSLLFRMSITDPIFFTTAIKKLYIIYSSSYPKTIYSISHPKTIYYSNS